jgi:hypothetical protein
MERNTTVDLDLVKKRLQGASLVKLMEATGTNKYRISKQTGVSYKTLFNWQRERILPSDRLALLVGTFLGLLPPNAADILELKRQITDASDRLARFEGAVK